MLGNALNHCWRIYALLVPISNLLKRVELEVRFRNSQNFRMPREHGAEHGRTATFAPSDKYGTHYVVFYHFLNSGSHLFAPLNRVLQNGYKVFSSQHRQSCPKCSYADSGADRRQNTKRPAESNPNGSKCSDQDRRVVYLDAI